MGKGGGERFLRKIKYIIWETEFTENAKFIRLIIFYLFLIWSWIALYIIVNYW